MAYRQCPQCKAITDENEPRCPSCANNNLGDKFITIEELVSGIKKGEITRSKVWTKNPSKLSQALESLPR